MNEALLTDMTKSKIYFANARVQRILNRVKLEANNLKSDDKTSNTQRIPKSL